MNCLIVDDEQISRTVLGKLIDKTPGLQLIASCTDAYEGMNIIRAKNQHIDLVFLDVEMPEFTGLDFLNSMSEKEKPLIIFVTSKERYAVDAFEHDAVDYLLKPVNYPRFMRAVSKARDIFGSKQTVQKGMTNLFVKKDNQLVKIRYSDIIFIEAAADYMVIYTNEQRFIVHITMKALAERLPASDFTRVHRTYMVRKDKIDAMEENSLRIANRTIPIGGSYKEALLKSLNML